MAEAPHSHREAAELLADAIRLVGESADLCSEARALRHQSRFVSHKASHLKRRNNDVLTIQPIPPALCRPHAPTATTR